MNKEEKEKFDEMIDPIINWIDEVGETDAEAGYELAYKFSHIIGIKFVEYADKRDKQKQLNNINSFN